jgi:alpha-beta hydrolase superfamily lysophospholipase
MWRLKSEPILTCIYRVTSIALLFSSSVMASAGALERTTHIAIRGHQVPVRLYGTPGHDAPIVLSSGDGGWVHLAPHVAEFLAGKGFYVVGLDAKDYLETFTLGTAGVRVQDEPGDYRVLAEFAARGSSVKPILIGVSEGAGLSVLAATDPETKQKILGVIGLGLPDMNELGWHWKDAIIYVTHTVPNEPLFSTAAVVGKVAPLPLAAIHSTHDEFVSLDEIKRIFAAAKEPKKLWIVNASNHRFSDNLPEFDRRLMEALGWVGQNQPR